MNPANPAQRRGHVVLMGVSGSGKTTLGAALATATGLRFVDADDYHPPVNRAKMAAGTALNDADRVPWLAALAALLAEHSRRGEGVVLACSALKRSYREVLRAGGPVRFVYLAIPPAELAARLAERQGHFFAPSLLASQLADLEVPAPDEALVVEPGSGEPVAALALRVAAALETEDRTRATTRPRDREEERNHAER